VNESLHEKDKLVDNLHDRLQTQMYDVQGVPSTNIPKQVASHIHNVSTTDRRDEPNKMGTCQLNTSNLNGFILSILSLFILMAIGNRSFSF
jgi:hypothetical protein